MKYLFTVITIMLFSCDSKPTFNMNDVQNYKCSSEQLSNVQKYYDSCIKTSFTSVYCYYLSVKNFCELQRSGGEVDG